jgi:hypothetical protein
MDKRQIIELLKPHTCDNCYFYGFVSYRKDTEPVRWCGGHDFHVNHPIPKSYTCSEWSTGAMIKAIDDDLEKSGKKNVRQQ